MTITITIKAGDIPQTIALPEGKSLTLKGYNNSAGVAYLLDPVLGGTNSLKSWAVGSGTLPAIGPYSGTQQILVSCSAGSIDASVGDAVLAVAGAVVGQGAMGFVGDSITAYFVQGSVATAFMGVSSRSWLGWALAKSGQAYSVASCPAKAGSGMTAFTNTIHPTAQEQLETVLATNATDVFVEIGINDIIQNATLIDLTTAASDLFNKIIDAGRKLHVATIMPQSTGAGGYSLARQGIILQYNAWLKNHVKVYGLKAELYDFFSVVVDDSSKTCSLKTNYSDDGLHPVNIAAYAMGSMVAEKWAASGRTAIPLISSAGDAQVDEVGATMNNGTSTNVLQNGMFNLGSPSAGAAQNWTPSVNSPGAGRTITPTVVTASSIVPGAKGNAQQFAIVLDSTGGTGRITSASFHGRVPSGARLLAKARIAVVGTPTGLQNVSLRLNGSNVGGTINPNYRWPIPSDGPDKSLVGGYVAVLTAELNLTEWMGVTSLQSMVLDVIASSVPSTAMSATIAVMECSVDVVLP